MTRNAVTTLYARERSFFFLALTVFSLAFSAYIYFLCSAVVHVVMRQETDAAIADMSAAINDLEMRYIAGKHAVTLETAAAFGFREKPERVYLARAATNLVLHTEAPARE